MQPKQNYQLMLDNTINNIIKNESKPTLLLHCCCAPCSSYVLEYLCKYFSITIYFYNPNITPIEEYQYRKAELCRLIKNMPQAKDVKALEAQYNPADFAAIAKGHENDAEGGERCYACYKLRLNAAALAAKNGGFDYFTTTLSISPMKNAVLLNEIGKEKEQQYGVKYLYSDFKKREGYKRSIELSATYNLYRQDYCGCIYSRIQRQKQKAEKADV